MVAGRQGSGHEDSRQGRGGDRWRQRHRCSHGAPVCSRWSAWRRRSRSRWGEGPRSRGRGRPRGLPRPGDALRRERRGSGAHADRGGLGAVRTGGSVLLERWRGVREGRRRRLRGVGPGVAGQRAGARVRSAGGAAVAFAEWLAVTYGDKGVRISVLCPQGVRTNMLLGGLQEGNAAARAVAAAGELLEPEQVADAVVEGLDAERFLILPHPEVATYLRRKAEDPDRWLAGMRRLVAGAAAPGAASGTAPGAAGASVPDYSDPGEGR